MFKSDDNSYLWLASGLEPELKAVCWGTADVWERPLSPLLWSQSTLIFGILAKDKGLSLKIKD